MSTPSPDFKKWLYCGNVTNPKAIEMRNFLKNYTDWQGQTIEELKEFLDLKGFTPFVCEGFVESIIEYNKYKDEAGPK
jgi:hypothetical protein